MTYFTSDNHFGHENIIRFCNRPFSCAEEMDRIMIENWNSRIRGNDIVYILGDMFFRSVNVEEVLKKLKGKKRLIVGNHDDSWMNDLELSKYFESVDKYLETSDGQHSMTMCHYPLMTWKHSKKNYMVFGHIHNDTNLDFWPLIEENERLLNAGADINNYVPVTFEELMYNNGIFKLSTKEDNS